MARASQLRHDLPHPGQKMGHVHESAFLLGEHGLEGALLERAQIDRSRNIASGCAREQIEQDLALLEVFAEKVSDRPGLKQVVDMEAVFEHLSESLHRELDFRQEAENIARMIFEHVVEAGYPITELTLWETDTACARYRRSDPRSR